MINDWKLGMRMLRYAHGIKMNCIAAGLVMLLEIPAVILGRMNGNGFPAFYMLLVAGMLPTQALFSLSVAGMVQASPLKKKLQTKIPALMNFSIMAAIYLTGGLFCGIMVWGKLENREFIYENMIILAIAIAAIMVYMGVAYKHFIAASAGLLPILCFMMSKGLSGKGLPNVLSGRGTPFWQVLLGGFAILAAGAMAEYLLSLLVYRAPMDKMAQSAPLRKEI